MGPSCSKYKCIKGYAHVRNWWSSSSSRLTSRGVHVCLPTPLHPVVCACVPGAGISSVTMKRAHNRVLPSSLLLLVFSSVTSALRNTSESYDGLYRSYSHQVSFVRTVEWKARCI